MPFNPHGPPLKETHEKGNKARADTIGLEGLYSKDGVLGVKRLRPVGFITYREFVQMLYSSKEDEEKKPPPIQCDL